MRSMRAWLLALVGALGGCCPFGVYYVTSKVPDYPGVAPGVGVAGMPAAFQVGDTVTFEADEEYAECSSGGSPAAPSTSAPGKYRWRSADPAVAQVLAPGKVRMAGLGRAIVRVSTSHAEEDIQIHVVPRVAAVRITPSAATIAVGDTIPFVVSALDSLGAVIPQIGRATQTATLLQLSIPAGDPVAANQATGDFSRYLFRGLRPGVVTVTAALPIYRASHLRAEARLEVR